MSEGDREAGKNAASQTEVTRADPERIADSRQRELGFPSVLRTPASASLDFRPN